MGRPTAMTLVLILSALLVCVGCSSNPTAVTTPPANAVVISPAAATVQTGATQQFTTGNTGVSWSVNGNVGGNSTTGLISPSGLYTAPGSVPTNPTVTVTAQTSSASGTATVTISTAAQAPINLAGTTWEISLTSASDTAQNGNIYNSLLSSASSLTSFEGNNFSCGSFLFLLPAVTYINGVDYENVLTPGVISTQNCFSGSIASINAGGYGGLCSVPQFFYVGQVNETGVFIEIIEAPNVLFPWNSGAMAPPYTAQITEITGSGTISADGTTMTGTWSIPADLSYFHPSPPESAYSTQSGSPCGVTSGTWTAAKQ